MLKIIHLFLTSKVHGIHIVSFDEQDFDLISSYRWYLKQSQRGKTLYARASVFGVRMHRLLLGGIPAGMIVDHIDGNGLNNTRSNLRLVTPTQNACNKPSHKGSTSKFKGVYFDKKQGKWYSVICSNGKIYHLGSFPSEINAAKAYNEKASELHGEFGRLNVF